MEDIEAPTLQNCSGLDVVGTTDAGVGYGTVGSGSVPLVYPSVSDNSGEVLTVVATVAGSPISTSHEFPYVGAAGDVTTAVTYVVRDSTDLVSECTVTVTIADDEAPTLQDCSGLDVSGTTDTGVSYGTEAAGGLALVYPLVSDNSDCYLQQNPSYCAIVAA